LYKQIFLAVVINTVTNQMLQTWWQDISDKAVCCGTIPNLSFSENYCNKLSSYVDFKNELIQAICENPVAAGKTCNESLIIENPTQFPLLPALLSWLEKLTLVYMVRSSKYTNSRSGRSTDNMALRYIIIYIYNNTKSLLFLYTYLQQKLSNKKLIL
jgi:hypothetical protein